MGVFWDAVGETPSRSSVLTAAIEAAIASHASECTSPELIRTSDLVNPRDCEDGIHYDSPGKDTNTAVTHRVAERLVDVLSTGAKLKSHSGFAAAAAARQGAGA